MEQLCLGIIGRWRNVLESPKCSWLFSGYVEPVNWLKASSKIFDPLQQVVCLALTELVRTVLCGRIPVILLYRLPNVKMVRPSKAQLAFTHLS